ncbi:MAG TPA: deoxyribonuclease IV [Phycisphaerales bacterium]|nr:deoxyribonuclease IV [Phycisphaerales bacterium]HRQ75348.1 deoxyribonuclease IV [Phycisphaerales bacterium]
MFGSHLSIAGSLVNALTEAAQLKMDCVQIFTKNQRQWKASPLAAEEITSWKEAVRRMGWEATSPGDPDRVVSHNSYLINMASPDKETWEKSVALQRVELERCETLGIRCCVAHPGAHMGESLKTGKPHALGAPPSKAELAGMKRIVKALDRLHRELPGYRAMTCLETTVGSGSNLGYDFAQLAWIRQNIASPDRVAFCFDTCHVTAAGYDMTTDEGAKAVLEQFDAVCGFSNLRVFHLNDSVGAVGSRRDRHAHIGFGACGLSCFRSIVSEPRFEALPMILETPKEMNEKGELWDVVNIRRLKGLRRRGVRGAAAASPGKGRRGM